MYISYTYTYLSNFWKLSKNKKYICILGNCGGIYYCITIIFYDKFITPHGYFLFLKKISEISIL